MMRRCRSNLMRGCQWCACRRDGLNVKQHGYVHSRAGNVTAGELQTAAWIPLGACPTVPAIMARPLLARHVFCEHNTRSGRPQPPSQASQRRCEPCKRPHASVCSASRQRLPCPMPSAALRQRLLGRLALEVALVERSAQLHVLGHESVHAAALARREALQAAPPRPTRQHAPRSGARARADGRPAQKGASRARAAHSASPAASVASARAASAAASAAGRSCASTAACRPASASNASLAAAYSDDLRAAAARRRAARAAARSPQSRAMGARAAPARARSSTQHTASASTGDESARISDQMKHPTA